jgi:anti-anti-sigma regulatory factor
VTEREGGGSRSGSGSHAAAAGLTWRIKQRGAGTVVEFSGTLDENANADSLLDRVRGRVIFDLEQVRRINSSGIREWIEFLRKLAEKVDELVFVRCSPEVVTQLNSIYNFRGPARIESFYAPYVCSKCHEEDLKLLTVADPLAVPDFVCDQCGGRMDLDEIPDRFFAFAREPGV